MQNPPADDVDMADLKRKSVRGGAVTIVSQAVSIAIQITSTVILARLLSPDDYGVLAMVFAVTSFAGLFRDLGLSSAAIQKKDLTHAQQSNLFWLNVAMGSLLTVLVAAGSPMVALFYSKPELTLVTVALSANFLIGSFGTQHGARLVREMKFGRQAAATISGAVVTFAVAVTLALYSFSYWSLVWGFLSGSLTTTLLLFCLAPFRPGLPSKGSGVRDMLKFGANVTAFEFVNYFHRNLDNILIGRFWGAEALGIYSRAYSLLMFPISAIRGPINAVAFPAMSKLQNKPKAFRSYHRNTNFILSLLTMPITLVLAICAEPLIHLLLGEGWGKSAEIFIPLAMASFILPVSSARGVIFLASGDSRSYFINGFIKAVVMSIGFIVGVNWGALGVAWGYFSATWIVQFILVPYTVKHSVMSYRDLLCPCLPAAIMSIVSGGGVLLMNSHLEYASSVNEFLISLVAFGFIFLTQCIFYGQTRRIGLDVFSGKWAA
jgi:PST family polysaccharide transporter